MRRLRVWLVIFGFACICLRVEVQAGGLEKTESDSIQQARVYHIMFTSLRSADAAYEALMKVSQPELFAEFKRIARRESADSGSAPVGGDLGMVKEGEMTRDFESASFNQKLFTVSLPIKTDFGWHLIYVTERSTKPIFSVCEEGLAEAVRKAPGAHRAALSFSKSVRSPEDIHPTVLQFIGGGWSNPLMDERGNLVYLRKSTSSVKANVVVVEQHTEYVQSIYNAAPQTCRRSAKMTFEVSCSADTVLPRSRQEFEGRGQSGRKLFDLKWSPSRARAYQMDERFKKQLLSFACAPTA